MNRRYRVDVLVGGVLLLGILLGSAALGVSRPRYVTALLNTPDGSHALALTPGRTVGQQFTYPRRSMAGIIFFFNNQQLDKAVELTVQLREEGTSEVLRSVTTTIEEARDNFIVTERLSRQTLPADELAEGVVPLFFPFAMLEGVKGRTFDAVISAKKMPGQQTPRLAFQIDSTKFTPGHMLLDGQERPGDAGFMIYEQPSRLALLGRWLVAPEKRGIWPGIGGIVGGIALIWYWRYQNFVLPTASKSWREAWQGVTAKQLLLGVVLIGIATLVIYWPATGLTLFQDDLVKLMRVREFGDEVFKIFFTNHRYLPFGNEPQIPVGFYRPISFSILPWFLWHTAGLRPFYYHLSSLLILAASGIGIYLLSLVLLRSPWAAIAVALGWIVHSSKVGAAYWWSSTEDLLGTLFLITAIVIYTRLRAFPSYRILLALGLVFFLAVFSKEHAVIFFIILIPLELFFTRPLSRKKGALVSLVLAVSPLILITGIFLTARMVAIHDPTLPPTTQADTSYALSLSMPVLLKNSVVYGAWTAENWLWAKVGIMSRVFHPLDLWLRSKLPGVQAELPYYPAVALVGFYAVALAALWRQRQARVLLLFAGVWWVIMLLPPLLFTSAWGSRWLTLASWSLPLGIITVITVLTNRWLKLQRTIFASLAVIAVVYGFWMARQPDRSQVYTDLDHAARVALENFTAQSGRLTHESTVYFYEVPHALQGTVNVYLLRLFTDLPFKTTVQTSREPVNIGPSDVVVTLRQPAD